MDMLSFMSKESSTSLDFMEITIAVIMAVSGVLTAWCGYQANLWSGEQAALYTEANILSVESAEANNIAGQLVLIDTEIFMQWLNASALRNNRLAHFYRQRFRPELSQAFEKWLQSHPLKNPGAFSTPFQSPDYKSMKQVEAAKLDASSRQTYARSQAANDISDDFIRSTVFLAVITMLAGSIQQFRKTKLRISILALATLMTTAVFIHTLQSPMK
jgi:hypothetical protein